MIVLFGLLLWLCDDGYSVSLEAEGLIAGLTTTQAAPLSNRRFAFGKTVGAWLIWQMAVALKSKLNQCEPALASANSE